MALAIVACADCRAPLKRLDGEISRGPLPPSAAEQHRQWVAEGDALWQERADRAKLEAAIRAWQHAIELNDYDWQTYAKLAQAAFLLGDGWLELAGDKPASRAIYERGYRCAERGMAALSPKFEHRVLDGASIEDAAAVLGPEAAPLVYWYAANLAKWAKASGVGAMLAHKDRIFTLVSRVQKDQPDYFYGGADRFLAAYYAAAPGFAGGDLEKSRQHFAAAFAQAPNYLGTYVLYAQFFASKQGADTGGDGSAFEKTLRLVLEAKPCAAAADAPCVPAELAAEAAIEKRKAARLLGRKQAEDQAP